jgi:hypothetical protein
VTIQELSYDDITLDPTSEDGMPAGIHFGDSGSKLFLAGYNTSNVYVYDLSTAWDLNTASYSGTSLDVSSAGVSPRGVSFSGDGTKMYVTSIDDQKVYEWTLSTAWDLTTASYANNSINYTENPRAAWVGDQGNKFYVVIDGASPYIEEFDLSTPYDLSTATSVQTKSAQGGGPSGIFFSGGDQMFTVDFNTDEVYKYSLSTDWDISTATLVSSFDYTAQAASVFGLFFNPDGTKMYLGSGDVTYQYSGPAYTLDGSVATIDFTSGIDGTYDAYKFVITGWQTDTDCAMLMRVSTDGGGTWEMASSYQYVIMGANSGSTSAAVNAGSNADYGRVNGSYLGADSHDAADLVCNFGQPNVGGKHTVFAGRAGLIDDNNDRQTTSTFSIRCDDGADNPIAIDGVRWYQTDGNIAGGRFTLYGIKHN